MGKLMIKISEAEHLHLLNVAGQNQQLTVSFGPSGVYVTDDTEEWALRELAEHRATLTRTKQVTDNRLG